MFVEEPVAASDNHQAGAPASKSSKDESPAKAKQQESEEVTIMRDTVQNTSAKNGACCATVTTARCISLLLFQHLVLYLPGRLGAEERSRSNAVLCYSPNEGRANPNKRKKRRGPSLPSQPKEMAEQRCARVLVCALVSIATELHYTYVRSHLFSHGLNRECCYLFFACPRSHD